MTRIIPSLVASGLLSGLVPIPMSMVAQVAMAQSPPPPIPVEQVSGTTALLQAVSAVTESVVWVSGHSGTWAKTENGGSSWTAQVMPGHEELQFRDIDAFDANHAYLLSAGDGPLSRIFRTRDGGESWEEQYVADHPSAFLDCMAFWDVNRGVAYGDAIDGTLFILRTMDGGDSWVRVPASALPAAQEGEGGFAASGSCVATAPGGSGWIAAGNAASARVFSTTDYGATWTAMDVPVVGGASSGLTSIGFLDSGRGFALGGSIGGEPARLESVAVSDDGGVNWRAGGLFAMTGPAYGAAWVVGRDDPTLLAVGPGGVDWSVDGGNSWRSLSTDTYWAVGFASPTIGWSVGPGGRITRWRF